MAGQAIVGKIELPATPRLRRLRGWVRLEDVSLIDAPARVLAQADLAAEGGTTIPFELGLEEPAPPGRRHALRAELEGLDSEGRLRRLGSTRRNGWAPGDGPKTLRVEFW